MPDALIYQQSPAYEQFRCIGADCEDTCCSGWAVSVDRKTYEKYQACRHPVLGPQFEQWIQIEPAATDDKTFARILLHGCNCPFLAENQCSIQSELGEDHLSRVCTTFPRIRHSVGNVVERSLDFSCPEAARLYLTDPAPALFRQVQPEREESHECAIQAENVPPYFWEIRSIMLMVLQNRRLPIARRLAMVGTICDALDRIVPTGDDCAMARLLERFAGGMDGGDEAGPFEPRRATVTEQLVTVLELLVARIKLDFTQQRYLDLYQEFVAGLSLEPGLNANDCGRRYAQSYAHYCAPFLATHEHVLEHYLVHYAYRTILPFGSKAFRNFGAEDGRFGVCARHYILLASYFSIIRATMIGLAARYGERFGIEDAIRCIQASSRTLEHCTSYPARVFEILAAKGIRNCADMAMLIEEPVEARARAANVPG